METKYGVKGITHKGIFFTEEDIPNAEVLNHVEVEISRQNADLSKVKDKLCVKASELSGQAISNFEYGQRKHSALNNINPFKWDHESWYGEGDVIKVD